MRNTTSPLLLPVFFFFLVNTIKAQEAPAAFDTIFQVADRLSVNKFHFEHPDFRNVGFERFKMKLHKPSGETNYERQFSIDGLILNDVAVLNWEAVLIGYWIKKPRADYSGSDEGWSFSRDDKFSWGEYFKGYVRSGKDTISNFFVYTKPASQEIFSAIIQTARSYNYPADPGHFKKSFKSKRNFAITGNIENIPFKILFIEPVRMTWIFKEEQLHAIFAIEDINNPDAVRAGGQSSNKTFLLLKPGHRWDDEAEMIRLSMLTMLIADVVKPGNIY